MESKVCNTCGEVKKFSDFNRTKNSKDGYKTQCRVCEKNYRLKNLETIKEKNQNYFKVNKEKLLTQNKKYYTENKKTILIKMNQYNKNRRKIDYLYKLKGNYRTLLYNVFKNKGCYKSLKSNDILGCSFSDLKLHLENQFEPWMNWDNHGIYNGELNFGWDIDHIEPLSSAKTEEDLIRLNHYTNLRPLCSYTNRYIKRNKH